MRKRYKSMMLCLFLMLFTSTAWAQFTVTGTVTDASTDEPLISVNVFHQPTNSGASTNADGEFSIELPGQSATLRISYIGYATREVEVSASNNEITVALEPAVSNLEELVVTGLASSVKRENLANAVTSIDGEELIGGSPGQTLSAELYGKIPGANISSNSGAPGGGFSIKLRGVTTINGNSEPLYIVDGIYLSNSAIANGSNAVTQAAAGGSASNQDNPVNRVADLNPDDIESIEVLKGASAAAIYGQRASGGVVIITTKRGKGGKPEFSASQSIGITTISNKLGQRTFTAETADRSFGAPGLALFNEAQQQDRFLDYEELLYGQEGMLSTTRLSSSFGDESTSFYVSGSLQDDEGIIETTGYEKQSIRANVDHQFTDKFNVAVSSSYIHSESNRGLTGNDNTGTTFGVSQVATPNFIDLRANENGVFPDHPFNTANQLQTRNLFSNNEAVNRVLTSVKANYEIFRNSGNLLSFQFTGGVDFFSQNNSLVFPSELQFERISAQPGTLVETNTDNLNTNTAALLVHTYTPDSKITLVSQGGFTSFNNDQNTVSTVGRGIIGSQTNIDQTNSQSPNQTRVFQRDRGFFLQEELNYDDTYILTAGLRADKSDRNGVVSEFFYYPKASFAWNLSNMDFWENETVNSLKLRVAYGQTGNLSNFGAKFTTLGASNIGGFNGVLITNTRGSDDIIPERQKELEAGVDVSALDGLANLSVTVYEKNIEDLLLSRELEPSTGFSFEQFNGGGLRNRGIEASLDLRPFQSENFRWISTFNFSKNVSEITELNVPAFDVGGFGTSLGVYRIEEGASATQIVGLDPETDVNGELVYRDGDGEIVSPDAEDASPSIIPKTLGDGQADFRLSWFNQLNLFKNVDFSFLLDWKKGGDVVNLTELLSDLNGTTADYDGTDLTFPDFVNEAGGITDDTPNGVKRLSLLGVSSRQFVQDASYLRMREIGLYYNVPVSFLSNISSSLQGIRFGVSATNLFTISPYRSYDPEVSNFGNQPIAQGIEVAPYPATKEYYFHFNLDF